MLFWRRNPLKEKVVYSKKQWIKRIFDWTFIPICFSIFSLSIVFLNTLGMWAPNSLSKQHKNTENGFWFSKEISIILAIIFRTIILISFLIFITGLIVIIFKSKTIEENYINYLKTEEERNKRIKEESELWLKKYQETQNSEYVDEDKTEDYFN
ncbi:hypothetical protein [Mycoplasma mycoides]|uniref:hypothetical protein n=1 Tax=Mycoplasma mycoides TaxID=2102 RepID=UPI00223F6072|nr:hypothetical protein [Mycoplasma mycoides]QVJ96026.1 hypothetical protein I7632_03265 [Mycoplasma mycoides subsp. capri]